MSEVESRIHYPEQSFLFLAGVIFFLLGIVGFLTFGDDLQPDVVPWIPKAGAVFFAVVGAVIIGVVVCRTIKPGRVEHAAPKVLPDVPVEPVPLEGSVVYGRLTHELVKTADGWEFRPDPRLWRHNQNFLWSFGVPFSVLMTGILSWVLHHQLRFGGWPVSISGAVLLTMFFGGATFGLMYFIIRAGYLGLGHLIIPTNGNDLVLVTPNSGSLKKNVSSAGLERMIVGPTDTERTKIPRDQVIAVQLCPWKFAVGRYGGGETTWAVQGLLVTRSLTEDKYVRLPVLLTSDFAGAGILMQRLGRALGVPYLFGADADGWKAEGRRAKERQPLKSGGIQS